MPSTLPISRLINVSVSLTPAAAQSQNLNSLLVLGNSPVIDVVTRIRSYLSSAAVAADFGTSAPEYLASLLWFQQNPQPTQLFIGRWARTASSGQLFGGVEPTANQLLSNWTPVTTGAFKVAIDGGAVTLVSALNFSGATTLPGVAAIISTGLTTASLGAVCTWSATLQQFIITSNSTGATSSVSFLTAPGSGTDISGASFLRMTAGTSGAYQANGIAAETALSAATLFDSTFGQQWYALTFADTSILDTDHQAVSAFIESTTTKHYYGVSTQEAGVLLSSSTTDVAYLLGPNGSKPNKTAVQYSSSSAFSVVSLLARILTVDYTGNKTAITLMWKQEPGIVAENLNASQIAALESKNANVFVAYNNTTAIIEQGTSGSGNFIDTVIGADNLAVGIQNAVYNLLFLSTTKIPQTDAGTHQIVTTIAQVCTQFANDGLLGAGTWTGAPIGAVNTNDFMPTGFYIFAPPVSTQTVAQRASRISVPIQVLAKLAGAVHTASVSLTINS